MRPMTERRWMLACAGLAVVGAASLGYAAGQSGSTSPAVTVAAPATTERTTTTTTTTEPPPVPNTVRPVVLTDTALLTSILNDAGQRLMGQYVPPDGHRSFVVGFHDAERVAQEAGAATIVMPDPVARAEQFVLATYPREVMDWRTVQAGEDFFDMLSDDPSSGEPVE